MKIYWRGKPIEVNENNPALAFHTGRELQSIEVKAVITNQEKTWKETFKVSDMISAIDQIKEVIQFFNDTINPYESPRQFISLWLEDKELSIYKDNQGMCGWLNPEGKFFPCEFGEHNLYALQVLEIYKDITGEELALNKHIPMSTDDRSEMSHIGILSEITDQQLEWFNKYFDKLSKKQKFRLEHELEKQGKKLLFSW